MNYFNRMPRMHRGHSLAATIVAMSALLPVACVAIQDPRDPALNPAAPTLAQAQQEPVESQLASLAPAQLDQLAAPIALYPDELVAQILAAATYPVQVVEADRWLQANSSLKGEELGKSADQQSWDTAVKGLVQFPAVLGMMDRNLSWTSSLGEAYLTDPQAVMDAVQRLRQRAQQAGNLNSTPQQTITAQGGDIAIEPARGNVVFVPMFDPWAIYGGPIGPYPGWYFYPDLYWVNPGIYWGAGIGIDLFDAYDWGWGHWGCDWPGGGIWFNHVPYVSGSPTFWHGPGRGRPNRPGPGQGSGPGSGGGSRPGTQPGPGSRPGPGAQPGPGSTPGYRVPWSGGVSGARPGVFSGYGPGGVTHGYSTRGGSSFGGARGGGGGGHGGGGRR